MAEWSRHQNSRMVSMSINNSDQAPIPAQSLMPAALRQGFERFQTRDLPVLSTKYASLADGQTPRFMIISCADSRVDPGAIFDADPGELFVVRNVANLVPPYQIAGSEALNFHGTSAAIEYAVTVLGVDHIVVIGHGGCGGVAACLSTASQPLPFSFVGPWVSILDAARDRVLARHPNAKADELQRALEYEGVRQSLANLAGFPFVAEAIAERGVQLHGAWFGIGSAELHWLADDGQFYPVTIDIVAQ